MKSTARSETAPSSLDAPMPAAGPVQANLRGDAPAAESARDTPERKPTWQGAPIGVKSISKPPLHSNDDDESEPPVSAAAGSRQNTRGVALPGMGSAPILAGQQHQPTRTDSPLASRPVESKTTKPTPPPSPTKNGGGSGGVSSVRAAAMRWGQQQADAAAEEEKRARLLALKASYGVKVDTTAPPVRQSTMPPPAAKRESAVAPPQKSKSVDAASSAPVAAPSEPEKAAPNSSGPAAAPSRTRPDLSVSTGPSSPRAPPTSDDIVSLVLSQPEPYHLPPGETLSLDVFHLNSPTDDPDPIDHNHVLHTTEILGIVHRAEDAETGGVRTHVWVWKGDEARETKRTDERIVRLEDKTGVEAVEIEYRHEPPALAEAFEGQLTICRVSGESVLRDLITGMLRRSWLTNRSSRVGLAGLRVQGRRSTTSRSACSPFSRMMEWSTWRRFRSYVSRLLLSKLAWRELIDL